MKAKHVDFIDPEMYEEVEVAYLKDKWGHNFSIEELMSLEQIYNEWEAGYEIDGKNRQIAIKTLTYEEFHMNEALQNGKDASKHITNIDKLMKQADLTPKQQSGNESAEFKSLPMMIAHVEKDRPCYIENHELKDVDKLNSYMKIFDGLIARTMGKSNENTVLFEEEYKDSTMDLTSLGSEG